MERSLLSWVVLKHFARGPASLVPSTIPQYIFQRVSCVFPPQKAPVSIVIYWVQGSNFCGKPPGKSRSRGEAVSEAGTWTVDTGDGAHTGAHYLGPVTLEAARLCRYQCKAHYCVQAWKRLQALTHRGFFSVPGLLLCLAGCSGNPTPYSRLTFAFSRVQAFLWHRDGPALLVNTTCLTLTSFMPRVVASRVAGA